MLHVRSRRLTEGVRGSGRGPGRLGLAVRGVLDGFALRDQGLLRLQMALRGTLSVFLTTLAAVLAGHFGGFDPVLCAGGITLGMMAPFLMREPTRRQRQATLLVLTVPAVGATVLTEVLHGQGPAGDCMFLVLVFLCFLLAPRNPRGIGLGLVAIITCYVGLYLELPLRTLPVQVASQVLAVPLIGLACFVLVPIDVGATLRRSVATVQMRAALVIREAQAGDGRLHGALLALNEAALVADDQVALLSPEGGAAVRARLVAVELWTARLIETVRTARPERRLAVRLGLHARRIGRGGRYATAPGQFAPGTMLAALVALGQAVHALGVVARRVRGTGVAPAAAFVPAPLGWRMAIRGTTAAGLAMAGGMALSPQRWFWAVITVYVVFLNARSRGDTIYKGVQRLGGTVTGIASGLVIATALSAGGAGDTLAELGMLLLSVFGMYYFILSSYTVGIFCVTVMLGLLYGMLGAPLETVLVLRLEETMVGAAAAMLVAALVLPARTREQVRVSGQGVLRQLAAVVRACAGAGGSPMAAMRMVDRSVGDLKLALAPLVAGQALLRRARVARPASALLDCVHWTRMLAAEVEGGGAGTAEVAEGLGRLAERLEALGGGVVGGGGAVEAVPEGAVGRSMRALDEAITVLGERMEIGAYEMYSIH